MKIHLPAATVNRSPLGTFLALVSLLFFLGGCTRREFRVQLKPDEAIVVGQEVPLNDRPVGHCPAITQDGPLRFATVRITDPSALKEMRVGVEREGPGALRLSTMNVLPNAAPLEPGALIPTRTPLASAITKTKGSAEAVVWWLRDALVDHPVGFACVILVAGVAFALLRKVGGGRVGGCGLVLFLAASHSLFAAEPSGVVYTREFLRGEQTRATRLVDAAQRQVETAARLVEARSVNEAAEQLVGAVFLLDVVELSLDGHLERVGALKSAAFSYSRGEEIKRLTAAHQSLCQQFEGVRAHASQMRDQCAVHGEVPLVLQVFLIRRESYRARCRGGLSELGVVLDECRRLAAYPFALVKQGLVNLENIQQCRINSDGTVTLSNGQVFSSDGKPKPVVVPAAQTAGEPPRPKQINPGLAKAVKPVEVAAASKSTVPPIVTNTVFVTLTNEIRTVVYVTNREPAAQAASASTLTRATTAETGAKETAAVTVQAPPQTNLPPAEVVAAVQPSPAAQTTSTAPAEPAASEPTAALVYTPIRGDEARQAFSRVQLFGLLGGVLLLGAGGGVATVLNLRQRAVRIQLLDAKGETFHLELNSPKEAVLLQEPPIASLEALRDGSPAIGRDWLGRALLLPGAGTALNAAVISVPRRLRVGDVIAQPAAGEATSVWSFAGLEPAEAPLAEPLSEVITN